MDLAHFGFGHHRNGFRPLAGAAGKKDRELC